ncbi:hypothetical protein HPP92_007245 [Vanilla planifolia]|uniref:Uncharacterized protein n=1 Tax=Vanilla planifolia TaxID=51239 RepID=A0A835RCA5_VANPL|nr:hypothetical protein HPP92_007245 [Vanilla planifolia]
MEELTRRNRKDEELIETIATAAAASLLIAILKRFLPFVFNQWKSASVVAGPPLLLFLLLHLIVASIVAISLHAPNSKAKLRCACRGHRSCRLGEERMADGRKRSSALVVGVAMKQSKKPKDEDREEKEEQGNAEELNARVEAFIMEFRRKLRLDSFSSSFAGRVVRSSELTN